LGKKKDVAMGLLYFSENEHEALNQIILFLNSAKNVNHAGQMLYTKLSH
jgi:hypothetical protein